MYYHTLMMSKMNYTDGVRLAKFLPIAKKIVAEKGKNWFKISQNKRVEALVMAEMGVR